MPGKKVTPILQVRMRVRHGDAIALGPGKIELLRAVAKSGSLGAAARSLGMSYMRAWSLVQEMHRCFTDPLVELSRGGKEGGGAHLSPQGEKVLELYSLMEKSARKAAGGSWKKLEKLLQS